MRTKTPAEPVRSSFLEDVSPPLAGTGARARGAVARRGRAALVAAGALALLLLGGAWWWSAASKGPRSAPGVKPAAPAPALAPSSPTDGAAAAEAMERALADESVHAPVVRDPVFDGRGAIRGTVRTPPGVALPERFHVVVEPALFTQGSHLAERREIEVLGAAPEFAIEDLPQAGYRVYAKAPAMNSRISEVMLVKGSSEVYKILELRPASSLDGAVRDEEGAPAAALLVTLDCLITGERMQATTDAAGVWRMQGVRTSRYRVTFGRPERPLLPPEELELTGNMSYPDRTIPVTASIVLRVVDERSEPLVDAQIRGWGAAQGAFDLHTTTNGIARVAYLTAGDYHVEIEHPTGRIGTSTMRVEGDEKDRVYQIVCRTPEEDAKLR